MSEILKVKEWNEKKSTQFYMVVSHMAIRNFDGKEFFSIDHTSSAHSRIWYDGRKGNLLEFMSDLKKVQIEVRKPNIKELPVMEFDTDNYDVLYVPINDINRRY